MGSLGGLMKLMPGMSKEMRQAAGQIDDGEISRVEAIVCSMTPAEQDDVTLIDGSRRSRIARGSGTTIQDVNTLLKQFKEMQKMMKGMASGNMPNIPGMGAVPGWAAWVAGAGRKLAAQAAGRRWCRGRLRHALPAHGGRGDLAGREPAFPGLPAPVGAPARGQRQQRHQKEEEGRPRHPTEKPVGPLSARMDGQSPDDGGISSWQ